MIFDYTNVDYPESSMQVGTLKKFAGYLDKDAYYFCNDYHKFLDTVGIGNFLREVRRKHNMTQKEFADYLGISLASYKTYEEERCRLPSEVYNKIKKDMTG